ncbi:FecCD family ABC transporter permease [Desulfonema magnum]|uniref:ABC transporter, permease protein n=1 Tax=Desulfonema magnum TaxID=45655 RepID=A0A975GT37_9BACT|nr:iron ABC transporter permease [Desulfonema magnum]QTA92592.1 putative ABC transporter, permease protein [Desulfonema magnum]
MHLTCVEFPTEYKRYISRKVSLIISGVVLLAILFILSISLGAVHIPPAEVIQTLMGNSLSKQWDIIIWNIRLPQSLTAIVAGIGLAVAGAVMQSVLRNPLGAPFTLGITHAAAFGAALSVMIMGTGVMQSSSASAVKIIHPYFTTFMAFMFSLIATGIIIGVSRIRGSSPEVMVLTGVGLGSLFTSATVFIQYFADDIELAAMVFWTFGDVARASWNELGLMTAVLVLSVVYFMFNQWNYNAINAGDETAKGLGVNVDRVRMLGMFCASLLTSMIVAFLGIIGFVGLVCPHMVRRLIGDDQRFLIPGTCVAGGILLLASDTAARLMISPHTLPVAVLTSFMGAPVFIYLIVRGYRR